MHSLVRSALVAAVPLFACSSASALPPASTQDRASSLDWSALSATPLDTSLEVRLDNGRVETGSLSWINDRRLVVNGSSFDRAEVLTVFSLGRKSKLPLWIGFGSGLGFSILINASTADCPAGFEFCFHGSERAVATLVFTGIGIGVGALVYAIKEPPRELIYRAGEDWSNDGAWVREWRGPASDALRDRYVGQWRD